MKNALSVFIALSLFVCIVAPAAFAVEDSKRWVCLTSEHCWKDPNSCAPSSKGNGHKARLTAKPGFAPMPGVPTYIVQCVATANDQICTTGNAAADTEIYGESHLDNLAAAVGYKFEGLFKGDGVTAVSNPSVWTDAYEWGDFTPTSHARRWYAMNFFDPTLSAVGEGGGQKLGTFDFETAEKDCISINWDPYGRVFDATTLEPVPGALVTLFVKKGESFAQMTPGDLVGGAIVNPQTTLEDGAFSFVVPDGDYKLSVVPPAIAASTEIDPNYTKAYFDIYPSLTGDVIQQRGAIQHRDIPVAASSSSDVKIMEYSYETNSAGTVNLEGKVSHPLSRIIAGSSKASAANPENKTPYRTVGIFYADKWGRFKIELEASLFEKTDEYIEVFSDIEVQKVDLKVATQANKGKNSISTFLISLLNRIRNPQAVKAQGKTVKLKLEPIPQYLEGYAYDGNGKPMPNATVSVYQALSSKPYSQTTADATGHFKLTSEYLPSSTYTIRYTGQNGITVTATTSKFIAQNQKYISQNNIDPFVGKTLNDVSLAAKPVSAGTKAKTPTGFAADKAGQGPRQQSGTFTAYGTNTAGNSAQSKPATGNVNPLVAVFAMLIILLAGVGVGILMYMKNKQPAPSQW